MTRTNRRALLAAFTAAGVICTLGCNPITLAWFMSPEEPKKPPSYELAKARAPELGQGTDEAKALRLVVVASSAPDMDYQFLGSERKLAEAVVKELEHLFKYNNENVKVVPVSKVERYKLDNPGWKTADAAALAKPFDAHLVLSIDISKLSLYEPGPEKSLLRGRSQITVELADAAKSGEPALFTKEYNCTYPNSSGPRVVDHDTNPNQFRQKFYQKIATEIAWMFSAHPTAVDVRMD